MKKSSEGVWMEVVWWMAAVGVAFWTISYLAKPGPTDWPSWVQAVGSIAAIFASARIAQISFNHAEQLRSNERTEAAERAYKTLSGLLDRCLTTAENLNSKLVYHGRTAPDVQRAQGAFISFSYALNAIDLGVLSDEHVLIRCDVVAACEALVVHTTSWAEKGVPNVNYSATEHISKQIAALKECKKRLQLP